MYFGHGIKLMTISNFQNRAGKGSIAVAGIHYGIDPRVLLSVSNETLTHSHTMTPFDAPGRQAF